MFYYAYGMNLAPGYMQGCRKIGPARLLDHRLRFAYYADIEPSEGDEVWGGVWEVDDGQLGMLDQREGYPVLYERETVEVELGGATVDAIVYTLREKGTQYPPGNGYLSLITDGYAYFDLPPDAYALLYRRVALSVAESRA